MTGIDQIHQPEHQQVLKSKSTQPGMLFELDALGFILLRDFFTSTDDIAISGGHSSNNTSLVTQSMLSKVLEKIRMTLL